MGTIIPLNRLWLKKLVSAASHFHSDQVMGKGIA
jgi:hypothetical protein